MTQNGETVEYDLTVLVSLVRLFGLDKVLAEYVAQGEIEPEDAAVLVRLDIIPRWTCEHDGEDHHEPTCIWEPLSQTGRNGEF